MRAFEHGMIRGEQTREKAGKAAEERKLKAAEVKDSWDL